MSLLVNLFLSVVTVLLKLKLVLVLIVGLVNLDVTYRGVLLLVEICFCLLTLLYLLINLLRLFLKLILFYLFLLLLNLARLHSLSRHTSSNASLLNKFGVEKNKAFVHDLQR